MEPSGYFDPTLAFTSVARGAESSSGLCLRVGSTEGEEVKELQVPLNRDGSTNKYIKAIEFQKNINTILHFQ